MTSSPAGDAPLSRRRRRLTVVALAAVATAALGLLSPIWIRSPQQAAADARPPDPTVLTAEVTKRVLRDTLVLRGDVTAQQKYEVTPGIRGEGRPVVTAVRARPGQPLSAGAVVVEVSGRPLFVLPGSVPAYRDLRPGATGKDVRQLQAALRRLGYRVGDPAGTFGAGTKRALAALYDDRGYAPPPTTDNDAQQLADAGRQVTAAQRQVDDARDALGAAPAAQRAAAQKLVDRAEDDLGTARSTLAQVRAATGPMLPSGEYVFLPSFPARLTASKAVVGAEVTAPLLTFSTGRLIVAGTLTEAQHAQARTGQKARITGDDGLTATGKITSIGELTAADGKGSGGPSYPVVVTPDKALPEKAAELNVRLTVEVASSGSERLSVPLSAIYASADGAVYVTKRAADGREERLPVQPGVTGEGYVEVTPLGGPLDPGDQVIVGVR